MRKTAITLMLLLIFTYSFSQNWKPNLGFEGGMGGGGMSVLLKSSNPLIIDNAALKNSWAYTFGPFLQIMKPAYGMEVKLNFNSFSSEAESFSTPESMKFKYMSVPVLFKIRLSSRSGVTSGSWTDESYSLIGNTLYHTPSEYSAGGNPFTTNVFLYAGGQYDILKQATHTYSKPIEDLTGKLVKSGYSFIAGLEFTMNMLSFDFSFQRGLTSFDPVTENRINAFFVKIKLRLI
jgi:hypothetical protein